MVFGTKLAAETKCQEADSVAIPDFLFKIRSRKINSNATIMQSSVQTQIDGIIACACAWIHIFQD